MKKITILIFGLLCSTTTLAESSLSITVTKSYIAAPYMGNNYQQAKHSTQIRFAEIKTFIRKSLENNCETEFTGGPYLVKQHPSWEARFNVSCKSVSSEFLSSFLDELLEDMNIEVF